MKITKCATGLLVDFRLPRSQVRIRKVLKGYTREQAIKFIEAERAKDLGLTDVSPFALQTPQKLLPDAIEEYWVSKSKLKTQSSQVIDKRALTSLHDYFEDVPLSTITIAKLGEHVAKRRHTKNLMVGTINRELNTINSFFRYCVEAEYISKAPIIKHLKGEQRESRPLREDEIRAVYEQANPTLKLAIHISSTLGLRAGEVCNLEWNLVDLDRCVLQVGGSANFRTKSGRMKTLPIPPTLAIALKNQKMLTGNTPWVLPSATKSAPMDRHSLTRAWIRARQRAGIKDARFHDLRATAGTRFAELGFGDAVVGKLLGHSSPNMARKYSHNVSTTLFTKAVEGSEGSFLQAIAEK